jgi:chemotaxis protein MotB
MSKRFNQKRKPAEGDEFLWLISLSDLMILLFIFFVVLFSFTKGKLKDSDMKRIVATLKQEPLPPDPVDKVKEKLDKLVEEQKLKEQISVEKTADGAVELQIKDKLLFSSGEFVPTILGDKLIKLLAETLEHTPPNYTIGIEGHTDDSPIHTKTILNNWDLSAKRSLAVFSAMNLSAQIQKRTILMAYGEMKPIVPNRTEAGIPIPENQSKNRRVTIRIF